MVRLYIEYGKPTQCSSLSWCAELQIWKEWYLSSGNNWNSWYSASALLPVCVRFIKSLTILACALGWNNTELKHNGNNNSFHLWTFFIKNSHHLFIFWLNDYSTCYTCSSFKLIAFILRTERLFFSGSAQFATNWLEHVDFNPPGFGQYCERFQCNFKSRWVARCLCKYALIGQPTNEGKSWHLLSLLLLLTGSFSSNKVLLIQEIKPYSSSWELLSISFLLCSWMIITVL